MSTAPAESPPALATTKRKFHKLLDNLTASTSTTSLTSTLYESSHNASTGSLPRPGSPEPAAKRPRSSEASMERQRQVSAGQARIQALKDQLLTPQRKGTMRVVGTQAQQTASTPRKAPNFQPYSQDMFLARLKTFADVKKWTTKPDAIGEVEWAKRGWSCDTWNTVACKGGCEKRVAVKLRPKRTAADGRPIEMSEDLSHDVEPSLVERYRAMIVDEHSEDCLWRKTGCQGTPDETPESNGTLTLYRRHLPYTHSQPREEFSRSHKPVQLPPRHLKRPPPCQEHLLSRSTCRCDPRPNTSYLLLHHDKRYSTLCSCRTHRLCLCSFRLDRRG